MLWFLYSLLSGFFLATSDAFCKKARLDDHHVVAWARFFFAIPFLLILLFIARIPELDRTFVIAQAILIPLDVALLLIYIAAIRISPLSLTMPFYSFTPVFLIVTSFVMLGELPTALGIVGILVIALGTYFLNLNQRKHGLLGPFKAIGKEKGSWLMLIAAFMASINSNLVKIAVSHSSVLFFTILHPLLVLALLSILFLPRIVKQQQAIMANKGTLLLGGMANGLMYLIAIVPYMIAIKRFSSVFGVVYGRFMFKERFFRERLAGALVMVAGAALIILGNI
jgi:drug/metabolite transporter (DMT)-like permease